MGHLALQHVQELLEFLLGFRVHEVILHELFDLAAYPLRQTVQLILVALRPLLQQLVQALLL